MSIKPTVICRIKTKGRNLKIIMTICSDNVDIVQLWKISGEHKKHMKKYLNSSQ